MYKFMFCYGGKGLPHTFVERFKTIEELEEFREVVYHEMEGEGHLEVICPECKGTRTYACICEERRAS